MSAYNFGGSELIWSLHSDQPGEWDVSFFRYVIPTYGGSCAQDVQGGEASCKKNNKSLHLAERVALTCNCWTLQATKSYITDTSK